MPVNPNIIFQQKPMDFGIQDPITVQGRAMSLRELGLLNDQRELNLEQGYQAQRDDAAMRRAFAQNPNNTPGALSQMMQTGNPLKAMGMAGDYYNQQAKVLGNREKAIGMIGDAAYSVLNAPSEQREGLYQQKRRELMGQGVIDQSHSPEHYDEGWLKSAYTQAIGAAKSIDQQLKELEAKARQQQADAAMTNAATNQQNAETNAAKLTNDALRTANQAKSSTGMTDVNNHPLFFDRTLNGGKGGYVADPNVVVPADHISASARFSQGMEMERYWQNVYRDSEGKEQGLYKANERIQAALEAGDYVDGNGQPKQPPQQRPTELDEDYKKRLTTWQIGSRADMQRSIEQNKVRAGQLLAIKNDAMRKLGTTPQVSNETALAALSNGQVKPPAQTATRAPAKPQQQPQSNGRYSIGQTVYYKGKPAKVTGFNGDGSVKITPTN